MARALLRSAALLVLLVLLALTTTTVHAFLGPAPFLQLQRRARQQRPQQLQELRQRDALPLVSRSQQQPLAVRGASLFLDFSSCGYLSSRSTEAENRQSILWVWVWVWVCVSLDA
jgi:hypothetical protein